MDDTQNQNQPSTPAATPAGNNKKFIIIAVVVLVGLYLLKLIAGALFSPESMVERAMEQATGGDVDIEMNESGSIEFTGENGENFSLSAGEDVPLPADWPREVPVPSDAKVTYAGTMPDTGNGTKGLTVVYTTSDSPADLIATYQEALTSDGWTITGTMTTIDGSMIAATKGEEQNIAVYIGEDSGQTSATVNLVLPQ